MGDKMEDRHNNCPKCGEINSEHARMCSNCYQRLDPNNLNKLKPIPIYELELKQEKKEQLISRIYNIYSLAYILILGIIIVNRIQANYQ